MAWRRCYGLSTQDTAYQREAAERLHLPFAILSDADLKLTRAMRLPTFTVDGMTLLKRMAWVIDDGVVYARVLSGVSAGPERRRGGRLAQAQRLVRGSPLARYVCPTEP